MLASLRKFRHVFFIRIARSRDCEARYSTTSTTRVRNIQVLSRSGAQNILQYSLNFLEIASHIQHFVVSQSFPTSLTQLNTNLTETDGSRNSACHREMWGRTLWECNIFILRKSVSKIFRLHKMLQDRGFFTLAAFRLYDGHKACSQQCHVLNHRTDIFFQFPKISATFRTRDIFFSNPEVLPVRLRYSKWKMVENSRFCMDLEMSSILISRFWGTP